MVESHPVTAGALDYDATRSGRLAFTFFSPFVSGRSGCRREYPALEGLKGRLFEFTLRATWCGNT